MTHFYQRRPANLNVRQSFFTSIDFKGIRTEYSHLEEQFAVSIKSVKHQIESLVKAEVLL